MAKAPSAQIEIDEVLPTLLGYGYVYLWVKRANFQRFLEKYAAGVLLLSLLILLIEIGLESYGRELARGTSFFLKIVFAICFTVSLFGKFREWTASRDDSSLIGTARAIAAELSRPHAITDTTLRAMLKIFHSNLEERLGGLNVTLALREEGKGTLCIAHRYPEQAPRPTRFNVGEGGAGYAYANRCIVCIPWKELGHAVIQRLEDDDPFAMITLLFRRNSREQRPYRAILCAPLVISGTCYGTLNFDCERRNAFTKNDLAKAFYFATAVAQLLHNRVAPSVGQKTRLTKR